MTKKRFLRFFLVSVFFQVSAMMAQEEGAVKFVGHDLFDNTPLLNTDVRVMRAGTTYTTLNTGSSNNLTVNLPFGEIYDLYFYNRKTQPMYLRVIANTVPQNKYNLRTTYELNIPFFPKDLKTIDTTQFRQPFHKIYFDGKNRFVDDTAYMNAFLNKLYIEPKPDSVAAAVVQVEKGTLVGNVVYDTKDKTPLQGRTVVLENKEGKVIATTTTTRNGFFVFQSANLSEAARVRVKFNAGDNPNQKVLIRNSTNESIESTAINASTKDAKFENTPSNNLIKRLVDNAFTYKIAGKLASTDGTQKKIIADKYVYLLNDHNTIVQKVKTNALGVFLFTNIKPNLHYSIAVEDKDCGYAANCKVVMYNTHDKKLRVIDSLSQNRFIYKFLAVSDESFNDLLVDDVELRMNVKGKVYGNNTNNPIDNLKILLMNDKYEVIDTAVTRKDGSFTFKYLPYTRQIVFSSDNASNILEAFNNIMVYDNNENLIKIVSLIKGSKFLYRPLKTEQSKLSEAYVDDPWMAYIDKDYPVKDEQKDKLIIENIFFESDKYDILPQAKDVLDKAFLALQLNPSITLELSAHTDSKGSDAYNLKLSENRANSAKQYLVDKGIDPGRIKAIGYGETHLLNQCDNKTVCSEEEHAVNRRIEFRLHMD